MRTFKLYTMVAAGLLAPVGFAIGPAGAASAGAGLRSSGAATAHLPIPHIRQVFVPAPGHATPSGGVPGSISTAYSSNWAGYAATGKIFKNVSATFSVPSVNCAVTPNAFSYHWVGIDGFRDATVEQDGVASFCDQGSPAYGAWYEMYPDNPVVAFALNPGDATRFTVSYNSGTGNYTLSITDVTSGKSFTASKKCPSGYTCKNNSAEVISEGYPSSPYLGTADYGIEDYVNITLTGSAGHAGGFTDPAWARTRIVQKGTVVDATPSGLWGGKAFGITWQGLR